MNKIVFTLLVCIIFLSFTKYTIAIAEFDVYGLSYHLRGKGPQRAQYKLHNKATYVLNPGLGITYDSRKRIKSKKFSYLITGATFKDCDNRLMYFFGLGSRYRLFFYKKYFTDINAGFD